MLRFLLFASPLLLMLWGRRRNGRKRANDAPTPITTAAEEAETRGAEAAAAEASRQQ